MRWRLEFFDSAAVLRAVDRAKRRAMVRQGQLIRTIAKRSIRKRKGASRPGEAPHSHRGHLRRFLFYSYDRLRQTVVIGPTALSARAIVPPLLEAGGAVKSKRGRLISDGKGGQRWVARGVRQTYRPRPFMGPALAKAKPYLAETFRGTVGTGSFMGPGAAEPVEG